MMVLKYHVQKLMHVAIFTMCAVGVHFQLLKWAYTRCNEIFKNCCVQSEYRAIPVQKTYCKDFLTSLYLSVSSLVEMASLFNGTDFLSEPYLFSESCLCLNRIMAERWNGQALPCRLQTCRNSCLKLLFVKSGSGEGVGTMYWQKALKLSGSCSLQSAPLCPADITIVGVMEPKKDLY